MLQQNLNAALTYLWQNQNARNIWDESSMLGLLLEKLILGNLQSTDLVRKNNPLERLCGYIDKQALQINQTV